MKCWNSTVNAQRLGSNYSSFTCRSNENICGSNGGISKKEKTRFKKLSLPPKLMVLWVSHPLNANVTFCAYLFWILPCVQPIQGSYVVFSLFYR